MKGLNSEHAGLRILFLFSSFRPLLYAGIDIIMYICFLK